MTDELDTFPWQLAEHLHMTLEAVGAMSNREYASWRAYFAARSAKAEVSNG